MDRIKELVSKQKDRVIETRRELHQIPEIGFEEVETSSYVAGWLEKEGFKVIKGIAKTGVVGLLRCGDGKGKTLLIRSDIDALPIKEETGLPFQSKHEGKMHACGHDGHMAMVLGAAAVLKELSDELNGTVKFVFQPAEEGPGGAKPMIDEGVMENPKVDYSIGCHLWPPVPEGKVGVKDGPLMAAADRFNLKIMGKGGHGAMPHLCIDPIDTAVQVINSLQRIVSRKMNPLSPTVVTIGSFHSGTSFNIIPDDAHLMGTTRTFDREMWERWPEEIERVVEGICRITGAKYELDYQQGYPPTVNDSWMSDVVREAAAQVVGEKNVIEPEPTMGGEDMAFFLERSRGCYFFLGVGREGFAPIHNPKFNFNEEVLLLGVEIYCRVAKKLLGQGN